MPQAKLYQELLRQDSASSLVLAKKCCSILGVGRRKLSPNDLAAQVYQIEFVTRNCAKLVRSLKQHRPMSQEHFSVSFTLHPAFVTENLCTLKRFGVVDFLTTPAGRR